VSIAIVVGDFSAKIDNRQDSKDPFLKIGFAVRRGRSNCLGSIVPDMKSKSDIP